MNTDAKSGGMAGTMPMAATGGSTMGSGTGMGMGMGMDMKMMDANGDGMISRAEFNRYQAKMWGKMKTKNGMISTTDMEATLKGGPN